jgi:DNA-binding SARP family transcriptional activator/TolB-like protein
MFRLHTFGSCFVTRDGTPFDLFTGQRKGLALLAMMAAAGERGVSRETVLGYLWPESDETRARISLKQLVHSLRKQSGEPTLLLSTAPLRLNPAVLTTDVGEFRDAVRRGDHKAVVTLYAGPFLDGFYLRGVDGFERWAATEREPLAREYARALEALAVDASSSGKLNAAVDWWRRFADTEPLSARAAIGLMLAMDAAGDRAAALQHARRYEQFVHEELGVAPDPSVAALVMRLQSAPGPDGQTDTPTSPPLSVPRASVVVLPFANTSREPANQPFVDGLTDELIGALGKVIGLKVAGRTSAFSLGGRGLSAREVGNAVGVATVLEGSVRRSGSRLKVTAQLVSAEDDAVLWTDTYLREVSDVFVVQEEIAQAIVGALRVKLRRPGDAGHRARLIGHPPANLEAYELYLKGRHVWNTQFSGDALALALSCFEQAVALDPMYARAYAGISDAHAILAIFGFGRAREEFAAAKSAAQKALALDDSLADAHVSLGHVLFVHDFAWDAAERSFRRGIEIDPANSSAHSFFAVCLQDQGRFDEAVAELQIARSIDPLSSHVGNLLGRVYVNARRADDAVSTLLEALEPNPHSDLAYQQLGHAYLQKNMPDEALAAFRQAAGLSGSRDTAHLAYGMAAVGDHAAARRLLIELRAGLADPDRMAFHIAMAHAGLGEIDDAFRWLERGLANRTAFMDGVKITPAFDPLHADPRWASLLRRMGLHASPGVRGVG